MPENKFRSPARPTIGRGAAAALALALWGAGCAKQELAPGIDESRVREVVTSVMQDQNPQAAKQTKPLGTLQEHEGVMFEYFGEKSVLKAAAMHRLGDLYLKLEDRAYRQQVGLYNQQLRQFQQKKISQKPKIPRADHSRSMKVYQTLLQQFPQRSENDRVLYQLARVNDDIGKPDDAVVHLKRLVDDYPHSPYATEVYFRLGEYYYDSGDFDAALQVYDKVLATRDETYRERALYKMGWAYFGKQDYRNAVARYVALTDAKRTKREGEELRLDPQKLSTAEWDFLLEVTRSMAFAFAYLGSTKSRDRFEPEVVESYFRQLGQRDYEHLLYRKLGELFQAQRRPKDGIATYEAFLRLYPQHAEAPIFAMEVIDAYTRTKMMDSATKARIRFVDSFGEGSQWFKNAPAESKAKVRPVYKKLTNQLALYFHSEAQRLKQTEDYQNAVIWYRKFLTNFPKDGESARINFLMAEALYELGRPTEAAAEYEKTAYGYFFHKDSLEAGYAAIVAYDKAIAGKTNLNNDPLAIRLAENAKKFADTFPTDGRVPDVLWRGTEAYFSAGQFPQARALADQIVKVYLSARHPVAFKAQRLIADAHFEDRDYERAAEAYRSLYTNATTLTDKERESLKRLWASSLYKQAEALRDAGRATDAETGFLRVQREVPASDVAPLALFDAGTLALQAGARDRALAAFQTLTQSYPKHELVGKVGDLMLQTQQKLLAEGRHGDAEDLASKVKTLKTPSQDLLVYQSSRLIADKYFEEKTYDKAAAAYRQLIPTAGIRSEAERAELQRLWASSLYKHAEHLKTAGKLPEAELAYLRVQADVPGSEVAPIALFDAGGLAMERKNTDGALSAYQTLVQSYPNSEYVAAAAVRVAQIYEKKGQTLEAAREYERVAQITPDRKVAGDAAWAAAVLYEQRQDHARMAQAYQNYADRFSGDFERTVDARFKVITAKQALSQHAEAQDLAQRFLDAYGQGDLSTGRVAYYVAKCQFMRADHVRQQYDQVRLVAPIEETLARKKELLEQVIDLYARAAELKVAEVTTGATYQIGQAFEGFRNALLESERPVELTPQQLEQYDFLLEEQAYPYEEQAILAYETNVRRAQEGTVYDAWVRKSYDELARLLPARYKKRELEEIVPQEVAAAS